MSEQSYGLSARVAVGALSSPLEVGADRAPQAANDLTALLEESGCRIVKLGAIDTADKAAAAGRIMAEQHVCCVALAATSWYEDYLVLDLLEECSVPVLLWSLPGMETGALCGCQQLSCCLKQFGRPYKCVYGAFDAQQQRQQALVFVRAAALVRRLRRARIGFGGHHVAGMTETAANEIILKKAIGPRIVPLDLPGLLSRVAEIPDDEAAQLWRQVCAKAGGCKVSQADGLDSAKVYLAIKELVDQHSLELMLLDEARSHRRSSDNRLGMVGAQSAQPGLGRLERIPDGSTVEIVLARHSFQPDGQFVSALAEGGGRRQCRYGLALGVVFYWDKRCPCRFRPELPRSKLQAVDYQDG